MLFCTIFLRVCCTTSHIRITGGSLLKIQTPGPSPNRDGPRDWLLSMFSRSVLCTLQLDGPTVSCECCPGCPSPPHYIPYLAVSPYVEGTYSGVESTIIPHVPSRAFDSQASLQLSSPISHHQLGLLSPGCHISEHASV